LLVHVYLTSSVIVSREITIAHLWCDTIAHLWCDIYINIRTLHCVLPFACAHYVAPISIKPYILIHLELLYSPLLSRVKSIEDILEGNLPDTADIALL
jgi:hypothetical protein